MQYRYSQLALGFTVEESFGHWRERERERERERCEEKGIAFPVGLKIKASIFRHVFRARSGGVLKNHVFIVVFKRNSSPCICPNR